MDRETYLNLLKENQNMSILFEYGKETLEPGKTGFPDLTTFLSSYNDMMNKIEETYPFSSRSIHDTNVYRAREYFDKKFNIVYTTKEENNITTTISIT